MLYLAALLLAIAIALFIFAALQRRRAGIPPGRVIYSDAAKWGKVEKPLYDQELRLTGKPDYLVKKRDWVIPVEVKSGKAPRGPCEWHIYQLAAYCVLVERAYGVQPPYGIISYRNRSYAVDFTRNLEQAVADTVRTMQRRTSEIQIDRSHHDQGRCLHCGYRSICDQALRI